MWRAWRQIAWAGLLTCLLWAPQTTPVAPKAAGESPSATMFPEVRMRKLHLVRPDLIPYPLAYEVYC
jgi:hypothetical protein